MAYRVKDLPEEVQPRTQVKALGVGKVSSDVLLAVLLRTGVHGRNVMEVAHDLLCAFGSLEALSSASWQSIVAKHVPGVGEVAAMVVASAFELERRVSTIGEMKLLCELHSAADVARVLYQYSRGMGQEAMFVLPVDAKNKMLSAPVTVALGCRHGVDFEVGQVFEAILRYSTNRAVIAHNHPSGDPKPSTMDLMQTRKILEGAKILNVAIVDHVIVGNDPSVFYSICESGLIAF